MGRSAMVSMQSYCGNSRKEEEEEEKIVPKYFLTKSFFKVSYMNRIILFFTDSFIKRLWSIYFTPIYFQI